MVDNPVYSAFVVPSHLFVQTYDVKFHAEKLHGLTVCWDGPLEGFTCGTIMKETTFWSGTSGARGCRRASKRKLWPTETLRLLKERFNNEKNSFFEVEVVKIKFINYGKCSSVWYRSNFLPYPGVILMFIIHYDLTWNVRFVYFCCKLMIQ